jgi:hypothetical protein
MTHLSMQNMNGVGRVMKRRISNPPRLSLSDIVPSDANPISTDELGMDPKGLSPNYAPWWVQPPLRPGEVDTQRATPTPGETRDAYSAYRRSSPLTPSNDARDLTNSFTGKPLRQLPRHNYPGSFPHTWIPYEDLQVATGPEMGPTPPGWAPVPSSAQLQARAENGGQPVPWVAEDSMTHDISGFSSLHQIGAVRFGGGQSVADIHRRVIRAMAHHHVAKRGLFGLGQIDPATGADSSGIVTQSGLEQAIASDSTSNAAAGAVTKQAVTAQAQGASPDTISQIINFGAKAATAALTAAGKLPAPKPAQASMLPTGGISTPIIIGGLSIAALGAAFLAMKSGKGGKRR